jgi:hemolysin activation/secretion protein
MMKLNKSVISLSFILLAVFILLLGEIGSVAFADNGEEESFGILIKGFDFVRAYEPPESDEVIALKKRRQQIQDMFDAETKLLDQASALPRENILDHIKFLEKSLEVLDGAIAKSGDTYVPSSVLHELVSGYRDRELTLDEMNEVADVVTIAYQERGYILAEAYVPEQEIEGGILKIAITEGDVGEIKVSGQKYYNERVIRRNFLEQLKHGVVKEELLEKGLLLSQDLQSAETRIVLKPGQEPGSADIVLQTEDKLAFNWRLDFNNFGSRLVGKERYGTFIDITDPWWGSTLSLRGVTSNDPKDSLLFKGDLSVPFGMYGTSLNLSYLEGLYVVGQELADLGLDGDTTMYGASISQPILRHRNQSVTMSIGYENKYTRSYAQDELENIDDLDVYYWTLDYDSLDRYLGKNIITLGYYWGSLNPDAAAPFTRANAEHRFRRYNLSVARIQKVYGNINFMLRGMGQISNQSLLPIEEMAIGGYGTVRGHNSSLFLGDSGFTISGEFLSAPPFIADKIVFGQRISQMVQFSLFYDYGRVYYSVPQKGEATDERLIGYGGGIRLYYKDLFSFKFDLARPTKKKAETEDSTYLYFMGSIDLTSDEFLKIFRKSGG